MRYRLVIRIISLLAFSSFFFYASCADGYKIDVTIKGIANQDVILAHYLNKSIFPDDTVSFNAAGQGTFSGSEKLDQGMYIFYLPSGKYFELLIGADQKFSLTTDTTNFVKEAQIQGSEDNEIFFDFQKYMIDQRPKLQELQEKLAKTDDEVEKKRIRKELKTLSDERIEKVKSTVADHPGLFVSTFLQATLDVEIPDPPKKEDGSIDSTWQYRYYKKHYFDNFDPHDSRLLRTPLYEDKVMNYLEKVIIQIPDTIIKEVDYLLDGAMSDSTLFRYLLVSLFNHYGNSKIMGMDAVQVHLAEKYYLEKAWWSSEDFVEELKERIAVLKPLILGNVAPDVELLFVPSKHFIEAKNDSALKRYPHVGQLEKLSDVKADYLVLIFWEASCSHCKKVVPDLYSIYKEKLEQEGIKVIAISTLFGEEGKVEWIDFVNKHGLYDWLNAWNPYEYKFKQVFDIRSTPQIFVLDKDKKLIGKRLGAEQVYDLIQAYKKQNK